MNNQAQLIGIYKRTFATKILELYSNANPLIADLTFEDQIGEQFQQPVDLRFEHAFTSAVNTVLPTGNAYGGYLDPIAGLTDRALVAKWPIDRIDPVLRALFRAAGAEFVDIDTPPKVAINEYVDVAKAFFPEGKESKFVNAVLDHMAREAKPAAF